MRCDVRATSIRVATDMSRRPCEGRRHICYPDRRKTQSQTEKLLHRDAVQKGVKLSHVSLLQMCSPLPDAGRSSV